MNKFDYVKKDQILAILDSENLLIRKNVLENELKSKLNMIKDEYEKAKILYSANSISKFDLIKAENNYIKAQKEYELSKIQIEKLNYEIKQINNQLSQIYIKSPIDGIIMEKNISEGQFNVPNNYAFIVCPDSFYIRAFFKEDFLSKIKVPNKVLIITKDGRKVISKAHMIENSAYYDINEDKRYVILRISTNKDINFIENMSFKVRLYYK